MTAFGAANGGAAFIAGPSEAPSRYLFKTDASASSTAPSWWTAEINSCRFSWNLATRAGGGISAVDVQLSVRARPSRLCRVPPAVGGGDRDGGHLAPHSF